MFGLLVFGNLISKSLLFLSPLARLALKEVPFAKTVNPIVITVEAVSQRFNQLPSD
jgi:hypothetical protein